MSSIVRTKITSKKSPWFNEVSLGEVHSIPISHGEGRFVAPDRLLKELVENDQIATQYVDLEGNMAMNMPYNPNGSSLAIEGITSKDLMRFLLERYTVFQYPMEKEDLLHQTDC